MSTLASGASAGRPNTRACPLVGLDMPSRTLMVVVLPAPLRPRNPKIAPAGTWRLNPRSASTPSYALRSSVVSMIDASATVTSCLDQPGQLRFEQPADLFVGDAALSQPLDGAADDDLSSAQPVGHLLGPRG